MFYFSSIYIYIYIYIRLADKFNCDVCENVLLSNLGYVTHLLVQVNNKEQTNYADLSQRSVDDTSAVCNKVCNSASGLRRYMMLYKKNLWSLPLMPDTYEVKCWSKESSQSSRTSQWSKNHYKRCWGWRDSTHGKKIQQCIYIYIYICINEIVLLMN